MLGKERYRKLCEETPSIPLFLQAWWLDAVAESGKWEVLIAENKGEMLAAMPYVMTSRYGMKILTQPPLTQSLGPWMPPKPLGHTARYSHENKALEALIQELPAFDDFTQCWQPEIENWLPFYWNGFRQTTRYTYRLKNLADLSAIWSNFTPHVRRNIRKAENRMRLQVRESKLIESLPMLHESFGRQGLDFPFDPDFLERVDKACRERDCCRILTAFDPSGEPHATVYIVWDASCAYYLMGGSFDKGRKSGAVSLCLWEAIKKAATTSAEFDFEGSMLQPVEDFFQAFGGVRTPFFQVTKTPSLILRLAKALRSK